MLGMQFQEMKDIVYVAKQQIEDIFHFIFVCPCYRELRESYIVNYYYHRPSTFKLTELFKSSSICLYCKIYPNILNEL